MEELAKLEEEQMLMQLSAIIILALILYIVLNGVLNRTDVYDAFVKGAMDACWGGVCDRRGDIGKRGDCVEDGGRRILNFYKLDYLSNEKNEST